MTSCATSQLPANAIIAEACCGLRPAGPELLGKVGKNEAEIVAMLAALWQAQA